MAVSKRRPSRRAAKKAVQKVTSKRKPKNSKRSKKVTTPKKPKQTKAIKKENAVIIDDCEDNVDLLLKNHVTKEMLLELLECNNVKAKKSLKKADVVEEIIQKALSRGQQVMLDSLKKTTMNSLIEDIKKGDAESPNNKAELQKETKELLKEGTLEQELKKLKVETLDAVCEDLGFKEDGSKKDKVSGLFDELKLLGIRTLFDRVLVAYLKELCRDAGLSTNGGKEYLVARFLGQAYRFLLDDAKVPKKKEKKEDKKKKEKKEKPPAPKISDIKKGVSTLDLHQYYTKDLEQYAKNKNLKKGKNKKELIKNILAFLDGDKTVIRSEEDSKRGKRKRGSSASGKNKKKKTA